MTNTPQEALDIFNSWTYNEPGMCLMETRTAYEIGSKYPDAATAWENCKYQHPGDTTPPLGAPVYWGGGSSGYGHIAIYAGNGNVRSTDAGGSGKMGTKPLDWFRTHWGLPYAGWAEDINGVRIPELAPVDLEDEDMAISDEDAEKIAKRVWAYAFENKDGAMWPAKNFLYWIHSNVNKVLDKVSGE